jgi:hypothetical protein
METIDMSINPKSWLKGIFVEGQFKSLEDQESQILGACSLEEAQELCLISPGEKMPLYCEDTGERLY